MFVTIDLEDVEDFKKFPILNCDANKLEIKSLGMVFQKKIHLCRSPITLIPQNLKNRVRML